MILNFHFNAQSKARKEVNNIHGTIIWPETSCLVPMILGLMVSAPSNAHVFNNKSSEKQQKRVQTMPQNIIVLVMLSAFLIFELLNKKVIFLEK